MKNITVNCDGVKISNKEKICLIAGPCQLENEQHALDMAGKISEISKKYNIGFIVKNCDFKHVNELEPWCSTLYCEYTGVIESYIKHEQKNTAFDLSKRLKHDYSSNYDNDILIKFDAKKLTADNFQVIVNLSEMLKDSGEIGKMEYDIYEFDIKSMKTYERDLINVV